MLAGILLAISCSWSSLEVGATAGLNGLRKTKACKWMVKSGEHSSERIKSETLFDLSFPFYSKQQARGPRQDYRL